MSTGHFWSKEWQNIANA